jgi:hypothetical protein
MLFPIQNGLKQDVSSTTALKYAIMNVQENYEELKLTDTHQLLVYDNITCLQHQNGG